MATIQELNEEMEALKARAAAIGAEIKAAQSEQKAAAVAEIKALMAEKGIKLADLAAPRARRPRSASGTGRAHPQKGVKVAAKYVSAEGETWSGRGLQPKWLRDAISAGHKKEDFAVSA